MVSKGWESGASMAVTPANEPSGRRTGIDTVIATVRVETSTMGGTHVSESSFLASRYQARTRGS